MLPSCSLSPQECPGATSPSIFPPPLGLFPQASRRSWQEMLLSWQPGHSYRTSSLGRCWEITVLSEAMIGEGWGPIAHIPEIPKSWPMIYMAHPLRDLLKAAQSLFKPRHFCKKSCQLKNHFSQNLARSCHDSRGCPKCPSKLWERFALASRHETWIYPWWLYPITFRWPCPPLSLL